jgi:hypothetical protein
MPNAFGSPQELQNVLVLYIEYANLCYLRIALSSLLSTRIYSKYAPAFFRLAQE